MSHPRYSIIPGGAVTDPRLKGRDLQVLCLLGRHTDKLGWCFRSQVEMAKELGCGRATLQRSLGRLLDAGWIDQQGEDGHSCYAYRVKIEHDDPAIGPSESEVEDQLRERGCPPVSTPAHKWAGGVPTYTWAHNDQEKKEDDDSRTRESFALAKEIAVISGITDHDAWPPGWVTAAYRVEAFLREGYTADDLRNGARVAMAHKRDGPPHSIEYFRRPWAKARGQREASVPQPEKADERQIGTDGSGNSATSANAHFGWLSVPAGARS